MVGVQVSFLFLTRTPAASGLTTEGGYPLFTNKSMNPEDEKQLHIELSFTRNLLCGMILCAYSDLRGDSEYKRTYDNSNATKNKMTAKHFFKSGFFNEVCEALTIPADKIRTAALK